jgi:hypothetical protein
MRPTSRPSPALVISCISLFVALAGVGVAANGSSLILGQSNTATARTSLTATTSEATLALTNSGSGVPLNLVAPSSTPPLKVSSATQVPNLNASLLGGNRPSDFVAPSQIRAYQSASGIHVAAGSSALTHADCPNGGTALGGGYGVVHDNPGVTSPPNILTNGPRYPTAGGQRPGGWEIDVTNETGDGLTVYPQVVCTR